MKEYNSGNISSKSKPTQKKNIVTQKGHPSYIYRIFIIVLPGDKVFPL